MKNPSSGLDDARRFQSKVVLVADGCTGIGRAAAIQFAREGAQVVVAGRRTAMLQALAQEQPGIAFIVADLEKPEEVARSIVSVVESTGRLDVVVNNVGADAAPPALAALKTARGCIVNILGTEQGATRKAALESTTRNLALDLAPDVRVNAIVAGRQARAGARRVPEGVASWALSIASPAAAWLTGLVITVDGGRLQGADWFFRRCREQS